MRQVINLSTGEQTLEPDAPLPPPKTTAELDTEASNAAKSSLAKLRDDTYPEVLFFLATLPGAPVSIKSAAIVAATEKAKVNP